MTKQSTQMYAPASPFSRPIPTGARSMSGMYRQVGVETSVDSASPHELVKLLLNGWFDQIAVARGAMAAGNIEVKSRAIGKAVQIVEEGLLACLDMERGGELSANLAHVYRHVSLRLTQANLQNDAGILDECAGVMTPIREAWLAIESQVKPTAMKSEVTA